MTYAWGADPPATQRVNPILLDPMGYEVPRPMTLDLTFFGVAWRHSCTASD